MSERKAFRNLSKSQRNRRLVRKICNPTCSSNQENINDNVYPPQENVLQDNYSVIETEVCDHKNECHVREVLSNEMDTELCSYKVINTKKTELNFKKELMQWVCRFNISHKATGALLKVLKSVENISELQNLPLDSRTLLHTPKNVMLRDVSPGQYFHYGLKNALIDHLRALDINKVSHDIQININIDGLPLAKSSKSQLYPILGQIYPVIAEPFIIGAYHGYNKPECPNIFLQDFIKEYKTLHDEGFQFDGNLQFKVTIRAVICDTPARSFVTCTKGFNGYFGCSKCIQRGKYISYRMIFLDLNAELRTDENFIERKNEDHHNGTSIFEQVNLGMISQFPLDYMHLVCLGVVKKMLQLFVKGQFKPVKFSANMIKKISASLKRISKWIPAEFARKTRSLDEIDRWKATELRLFLLYIGPVILQNYLSDKYMIHFNALHCAIRILCHKTDCIINNEYAKDLLIYFVKTCQHLYGEEFMIYNIHNLIHLSNDVAKFGNLDSFSSFPFESFLFSIKKQLKKGDKPLQQLFNRIVERANCNFCKKIDTILKPQVKNFNAKKSAETRIDSFDNIVYKDFTLSVKKINNRFCYLKNNNILSITNICIYNNNIILKGKTLLNPVELEHYPISSLQFNIVVGNTWSNIQTFNSDDVCTKAVCVPYGKSYCFLPLIHTAI